MDVTDQTAVPDGNAALQSSRRRFRCQCCSSSFWRSFSSASSTAKATLNHAALQAARAGAVSNATPAAIRRGLAQGLAPLTSPDASLAGIAESVARVESELLTDARIRILNPTREAFDDFAVEVDGVSELPNDRLHARDTRRGTSGGLNIQDANLLRVEVTYGYELKVPLINGFISRLLGMTRDSDAFHQQLLRRTRLPITSTATVRMQSPLRFSELLVSRRYSES